MRTLTLREAIAQQRTERKFAGYGPAIDALRDHCPGALSSLAEHADRALRRLEELRDMALWDMTSDTPVVVEQDGRLIDPLRAAIDAATTIKLNEEKK